MSLCLHRLRSANAPPLASSSPLPPLPLLASSPGQVLFSRDIHNMQGEATKIAAIIFSIVGGVAIASVTEYGCFGIAGDNSLLIWPWPTCCHAGTVASLLHFASQRYPLNVTLSTLPLNLTSLKPAGAKLTQKLRRDSMNALLRQHVGFFDNEKNSAGQLVAFLGEKIILVQALNGERLQTMVSRFGTSTRPRAARNRVRPRVLCCCCYCSQRAPPPARVRCARLRRLQSPSHSSPSTAPGSSSWR